MGLIKKFFTNAAKPSGPLGKIMITEMNIFHARVAHWGMSRLNIPAPSDLAARGTGVDYSPLSVREAKSLKAVYHHSNLRTAGLI